MLLRGDWLRGAEELARRHPTWHSVCVAPVACRDEAVLKAGRDLKQRMATSRAQGHVSWNVTYETSGARHDGGLCV